MEHSSYTTNFILIYLSYLIPRKFTTEAKTKQKTTDTHVHTKTHTKQIYAGLVNMTLLGLHVNNNRKLGIMNRREDNDRSNHIMNNNSGDKQTRKASPQCDNDCPSLTPPFEFIQNVRQLYIGRVNREFSAASVTVMKEQSTHFFRSENRVLMVICGAPDLQV